MENASAQNGRPGQGIPLEELEYATDLEHVVRYHSAVSAFAADIGHRDSAPMVRLVVDALQLATARRIGAIEHDARRKA